MRPEPKIDLSPPPVSGNFYYEMYNPLKLYECKNLIWTEVNPVHLVWTANFPFVSKLVGMDVIGI